MNKILSSRRFWAFILTMVANVTTLVINHYVNDPFMRDLSVTLVASFTTIGGIVITCYTIDDVASNVTAIKAGSHPYFQNQQPPF
jgi:hypothetical protein